MKYDSRLDIDREANNNAHKDHSQVRLGDTQLKEKVSPLKCQLLYSKLLGSMAKRINRKKNNYDGLLPTLPIIHLDGQRNVNTTLNGTKQNLSVWDVVTLAQDEQEREAELKLKKARGMQRVANKYSLKHQIEQRKNRDILNLKEDLDEDLNIVKRDLSLYSKDCQEKIKKGKKHVLSNNN